MIPGVSCGRKPFLLHVGKKKMHIFLAGRFSLEKERDEPNVVSLFSPDLLCHACKLGGVSLGGTARSQGFYTSGYLSTWKKSQELSQRCSSRFHQMPVLHLGYVQSVLHIMCILTEKLILSSYFQRLLLKETI